ncbi:MAG: LysR family transcriptional regulator [Clostridium sp.]|nr:LysR family transcriptional regulator [Clostridium sp.]
MMIALSANGGDELDNPNYLSLTLQHFQYFVLVVEQGTMMKAAEVLNVSQPLLSQKIAQLEKELGVKLFDRNKGKLHLTEAGIKFLEYSRAFLSDMDQVFSSLKESYTEVSEKPVRMGFSDGNESSKIKKVIRMFKQSFPDAPIEVDIDNRLRISEKLLSGELDICHILDTENLHLNKNISYRKLYNLSINGIVNRANPLAEKEHVSWRDLDGMTCYWQEILSKTTLTKDIQRYLRAKNVSIKFQYRNVDYFTLRKYLRVDDSLIFTFSEYIDDPTLRLLPLGGITYPFIIAWKKTDSKRLECYTERLAAISKSIMKAGI